MNEKTYDALKLILTESNGVLSTHSLELEGYPFGSITPYCLDDNFSPIILVSGIAQHTHNMDANPKVSLTITESSQEAQKQNLGRLTFVADANRIDNQSEDYKNVSQIYLRYFPAAKHYFEAHDFYFYRLNFVRARFIKGFGKIFWIEKEDWNLKNSFSPKEQDMMITHMNEDHKSAQLKYCSNFANLKIEDTDSIQMVGINQFGFDLLHQKNKIHFEFQSPVQDVKAARTELVDMAKESS